MTKTTPPVPPDELIDHWYSYCPEDGFEWHSSKDEAKAHAADILDGYKQNAAYDGWHEDQEWVQWGYMVPCENAQVVERSPDPAGVYDELVIYEMLPSAAWGWEQAIPEREDLATLLMELAKYLEIPDIELGIIPSKNRKLADRARAAAERLRGGGSDG